MEKVITWSLEMPVGVPAGNIQETARDGAGAQGREEGWNYILGEEKPLRERHIWWQRWGLEEWGLGTERSF